jgi:hypothetical protein
MTMERKNGWGFGRGWRWLAAAGTAAVLGLVLGLPISCSDECSTGSDCPAGQYCFQGSCRVIVGADADADADVAADADADGVTPTDGDADPDVVRDDATTPDTTVCGCTRNADCPPSSLPCTFFVCNTETGCCDELAEVPDYCAAAAGPTYCGGALWCLRGAEMAGTTPEGTSRCDDGEPPEYDNCDIDGSGACSLTVTTRVCPW